MKNNTPPTSESAVPLILKLTLIGGGVLVMVMLVLTARSIIRIFRPSSSSPAAVQTNAETDVVQPQTPAGTPRSSAFDNLSPLPAPGNSEPEVSPANRTTPFAVQAEIMRQREQARIETIKALKREAQEQTGTSGVPREALQKLEQSDPILY